MKNATFFPPFAEILFFGELIRIRAGYIDESVSLTEKNGAKMAQLVFRSARGKAADVRFIN